MPKCDRCKKPTNVVTMSYFNTQTICMECDDKERKHPKFKEAQEAEMRQVRQGNFNFGGIGLPSNL